MTILEEIAELKDRLDRAADKKEEAELLLEILNKYASINSADSKPFIDRLLHLAEKINSASYKAWALYYDAILCRLKGEYEISFNITQQAFSLFELMKDMKGLANCHSNLGMVHYNQGNYTAAMENFLLSQRLREETSDQGGIATSYNSIGLVYDVQGNYPEAMKNYLQSLRIMEQIGDRGGIAISYSNIGIIHEQQGNYPEALKNHLKALKLREETGDRRAIAISHHNIGGIHYLHGNYPEAFKSLLLALRIREEIGDKQGLATSYNNIGGLYYNQRNYPEALKSLTRSLHIRQEIGDKMGIASSHNNIGNIHKDQGNYQAALKDYLSALHIREEIGEKRGILLSCVNIGNVYLMQGDYPSALKFFSRALQMGLEIGDKQQIANCYTGIGDVYEKEGDHSTAVENKLLAFRTGEETHHKDLIKDASLSLFNSYKANDDFENALKYYEKYHQAESELLGEQSQKQLTHLNFIHNMEQKEKEMEITQLRNVELKNERDRSESLLLNILPSEVAEELKAKGTADAKLFDDVTILFTDFKGFTNVSERLSPQELVGELHECFKAFDDIIGKYNIEKIKTVGDAYLAAAGVPVPNSNHAEDMVKAAIEIRDFMLNRKKELGKDTFEMRVGLHSGKVVAGIVGVKKFAYDIWGDTVNTAARMEQNGEAGKVNLSETTYELVKDKFTCEYRGEIEAKNKGRLKMYFVE